MQPRNGVEVFPVGFEVDNKLVKVLTEKENFQLDFSISTKIEGAIQ